jgi:hypothetical protein
LALFEIEVDAGTEALIVASIVTVTERPGSRQETLTVTTCPAVDCPVENAVPPVHVPPCVLEIFTVLAVRFASRVSLRTRSNAVVALFPAALLLNTRV